MKAKMDEPVSLSMGPAYKVGHRRGDDDDYLFRSSLSDYFYSFISFFDWRPSFFIASIIYTITKIVSILYLSFQSHYAYCIMTFWRWRKEK